MMRTKWYHALLLNSLLGVFWGGCEGGSGSSDGGQVKVISVTAYEEIDEDSLLAGMEEAGLGRTPLSTSLGVDESVDEGINDILTLFNLIRHWLPDVYILPTYTCIPSKVVYQWAGSSQESGLLVEPGALVHLKSYPMIVFLHPTLTERSQSPSLKTFDNELTGPYARLLAMLGYIVVVPDYPGMGVNKDVHPYCLTTLVKSATDMIYAVKQLRSRWNGQILLMGFSEGGYATLVTAKEIEENHPDLNLVGAAVLDGPHSLSDTMHDLILTAGDDFATPYFLPYVIAGYGDAYPEVLQFGTAVLDTPEGFNADLYAMLFGDYSGGEISGQMKAVQSAYEGPRSILTQETINQLSNDTSDLNQLFKENDSFYNWIPEDVKIVLFHNSHDDSVPVENSRLAKAAWRDVDNVELHLFDDYVRGLGTVHAGALPYAYFLGTRWIYNLAH